MEQAVLGAPAPHGPRPGPVPARPAQPRGEEGAGVRGCKSFSFCPIVCITSMEVDVNDSPREMSLLRPGRVLECPGAWVGHGNMQGQVGHGADACVRKAQRCLSRQEQPPAQGSLAPSWVPLTVPSPPALPHWTPPLASTRSSPQGRVICPQAGFSNRIRPIPSGTVLPPAAPQAEDPTGDSQPYEPRAQHNRHHP